MRTVKLNEVLTLKNGTSSPPRHATGIYEVLGANGNLGRADVSNVSQACIVIGRVGSAGSIHFSSAACWVTDNAMIAHAANPKSTLFWFYLLHTLDLPKRSHGSSHPLLNQNILGEIEVLVPSDEEQDAIAEVLGALDDKIAANSRVMELTDELVRSAYLSLDREDAVPLSDIAINHRSTVSPDLIDPSEPYLGLEHFDSRSLWIQRSGRGSDVGSTKSRFEAGDTLFGKLRPYFHKVSAAPGNGICSTDILVLRPIEPEWGPLVLAAASSDEAVGRAVQNSNGTKMPRAKWADIEDILVPSPASKETLAFMELTSSLTNMAAGLATENIALARTRDELLPLLMSGRMKVRDAQARVEEVAL